MESMVKVRSKHIYLGVGSNRANRRQNILRSIYLLKRSGIYVTKKSKIYKTEPWGYVNQKEFYNAVFEVKTNLKPKVLLAVCQKIEKKMGKRKRFKWGPRVIDIDILIYKNYTKRTKILTIPHKYITQRVFTVIPLAMINKNIRLNGFGIDYFIDRLHDKIEPVS
jgi:2-amino-4-hydroxy-6-hydroxymethyldihydropteridine diphosphokinase